MRNILKDKTGGFTDIFIFIISAFIIVLFCVMFVYMGNKVQDKLLESDFANRSLPDGKNYSDVIKDSMGDLNVAYSTLRWISFFLIIGMIISIIVGSFLVTTKPVFFVPYIFIVLIAVLVAVPLANSYEDLMADETLSSTFDQFTGTNYIMLNFPLIVSIIGFLGAIVMFVSFKRAQDEYY